MVNFWTRAVALLMTLAVATLLSRIAEAQGLTPQAEAVKQAMVNSLKLPVVIPSDCTTKACLLRSQQGSSITQVGIGEESILIEVRIWEDEKTAQGVLRTKIEEMDKTYADLEKRTGRKAHTGFDVGTGTPAVVTINQKGPPRSRPSVSRWVALCRERRCHLLNMRQLDD